MKEIRIKQFDIDEISEITLLSLGEAKKLPESILACRKEWWLRSPGDYKYRTTFVYFYGDVDESGDIVFNIHFVVRPAFRITNLKSKIGDRVMVNKTWCTVIDEDLVLADYPICEHRFDSESNEWETSELKKFMNSEEFISLL